MVDQALEELEKEAEERLKKWIDDWLSDKLNDFSFGTLIILNWLEKKCWGFQKFDDLKLHTGFLIGYLSAKHEEPKKKQQIKEKLQKIKRIWDDHESSKAEKEQDADAIFDEIIDLLLEITGLFTVGEK